MHQEVHRIPAEEVVLLLAFPVVGRNERDPLEVPVLDEPIDDHGVVPFRAQVSGYREGARFHGPEDPLDFPEQALTALGFIGIASFGGEVLAHDVELQEVHLLLDRGEALTDRVDCGVEAGQQLRMLAEAGLAAGKGVTPPDGVAEQVVHVVQEHDLCPGFRGSEAILEPAEQELGVRDRRTRALAVVGKAEVVPPPDEVDEADAKPAGTGACVGLQGQVQVVDPWLNERGDLDLDALAPAGWGGDLQCQAADRAVQSDCPHRPCGIRDGELEKRGGAAVRADFHREGELRFRAGRQGGVGRRTRRCIRKPRPSSEGQQEPGSGDQGESDHPT